MNGKIFIDTNLFVYSVDDGEPAKQLAAKNIISKLSENGGVISTQVLQEFYNVISNKLRCPKDIAKQFVEDVSDNFIVHKNSVHDILKARQTLPRSGKRRLAAGEFCEAKLERSGGKAVA